MIFPLKERVLNRGCAAHVAAGLGCAADYKAHNVELSAPVSGIVQKIYTGTQGGKWLWLLDDTGRSWQFAHLSEYKVTLGANIKERQLIAITGNTGELTTGPHLHLQIIKDSKRLDPEVVFLEINESNNMIEDIVKRSQKKLKDIEEGRVAYVLATPSGEVYEIKNSAKKKLPNATEAIVRAFFATETDDNMRQIPDA